ncbi:hypothetical protein HDU76_006110 [Blyttiomyces sp. JEL0837]|nr:hypothetical protein HDU76_006110 [Blyttiomyces sp. JEL0837]
MIKTLISHGGILWHNRLRTNDRVSYSLLRHRNWLSSRFISATVKAQSIRAPKDDNNDHPATPINAFDTKLLPIQSGKPGPRPIDIPPDFAIELTKSNTPLDSALDEGKSLDDDGRSNKTAYTSFRNYDEDDDDEDLDNYDVKTGKLFTTKRPKKRLAWEQQQDMDSDLKMLAINKTVFQPVIRQRKFSAEEDRILLQAYSEMGPRWKAISAKYFPYRKPFVLKTRWEYLDPRISKSAWTPEEDAKLLELYEELGRKWTLIAERMPHRNARQVRMRYTHTLKPRQEVMLKDEDKNDDVDVLGTSKDFFVHPSEQRDHFRKVPSRPWTDEENKILLEGVARFGHSWRMIVKYLPGRSITAASDHYWSNLRPKVNAETGVLVGSGSSLAGGTHEDGLRSAHFTTSKNSSRPWTPDEDELLLHAVNTLWQNTKRIWITICERYFPDRTTLEVRSRFQAIDPRRLKEPFTNAEQKLLEKAVKVFGNNFSHIARLKAFEGRTPTYLFFRWTLYEERLEFTPWTPEEDELILTNAEKGLRPREIAKMMFGRSVREVYYRSVSLLKKKTVISGPLSSEEEALLLKRVNEELESAREGLGEDPSSEIKFPRGLWSKLAREMHRRSDILKQEYFRLTAISKGMAATKGAKSALKPADFKILIEANDRVAPGGRMPWTQLCQAMSSPRTPANLRISTLKWLTAWTEQDDQNLFKAVNDLLGEAGLTEVDRENAEAMMKVSKKIEGVVKDQLILKDQQYGYHEPGEAHFVTEEKALENESLLSRAEGSYFTTARVQEMERLVRSWSERIDWPLVSEVLEDNRIVTSPKSSKFKKIKLSEKNVRTRGTYAGTVSSALGVSQSVGDEDRETGSNAG